MRTRTRITSAVAICIALITPQIANAQAVTVIGGGMARECYEAVEDGRAAVNDAMRICDLALQQERLTAHNRAATHVNRGILHMRAGRHDRALADFERGVTDKPELLEGKVNLGAALYNMQRYEEALVALNAGVGTDDARARSVGHYNRGLTHEKLGKIQEAYADFKEALAIQPEFLLAQEQLSRFQVVPKTP